MSRRHPIRRSAQAGSAFWNSATLAALLLSGSLACSTRDDGAPADPPPAPIELSLPELEQSCREALPDWKRCRGYLAAAVQAFEEDRAQVFFERLAAEQPRSWIPSYLIGELRHRAHGARRTLALEAYESAERQAMELGDPGGEAIALSAQAGWLKLAERREEASVRMRRALERARASGDRRLIAEMLFKISVEHQQAGRYYDERRLLDEGDRLLGPETNDQFRRKIVYQQGQVARRMGRHREAATHYSRVLELARADDDPKMEARGAMTLGYLALDAGENSRALSRFDAAVDAARRAELPELEIEAEVYAGTALGRAGNAGAALGRLTAARERSSGRGVVEAIALQHLADAEQRSGRLTDAREHYEQSLELAEEARFVELRFRAMAGLAAVQRSLGDDEQAVSAARAAEAMIETMRDNISDVAERSHFLHLRSDVYQILASSIHRQRGATAEAFAAVEQAHARTLRETLATSSSVSQAVETATLSTVRQALQPGELLVEFLLGEDESTAFVIDRDDVEVYRLAPRAEIERAVASYRAALFRPLTTLDARLSPESDFRRLAPLGHELYRTLLGAFDEKLGTAERLLIVPDRRLHLLPFGALLPMAPEDGKPLSFLATRSAIEYLPAASFVIRRREPSGNRVVAAVAAQGSPQLDLAALKHARDEAQAVVASYPSGSTVLLENEDTTLDRLGRAMPDAVLLHLVAHAVLDIEGPHVILGAAPGEEPEVLDVASLERIGATPPLVVLSACDSARGELVGGEGILGLVRAFMLAGSDQVVASLWQVDDAAAVELMRRFHKGLSQGQRPSEALRDARRQALSDGFKHPFYWSSFVLYGAD